MFYCALQEAFKALPFVIARFYNACRVAYRHCERFVRISWQSIMLATRRHCERSEAIHDTESRFRDSIIISSSSLHYGLLQLLRSLSITEIAKSTYPSLRGRSNPQS
ncbi:hypothetical protein [Helicobacter sp. MIT 05-5294]|uniref:hypothetical protein n=1 Tax=Helicobacter sp. MIT 05-5294 TaxID=1548150 RepID=UPI0010FE2860|nr:hypothetical protein [Helicobacter sp. MIT 05-5294]TLD86500.1 hypothetical protein LS69_005725 [Helicobacter sp. MIT 05-5294]